MFFIFCVYFASKLPINADSDSLILENDKDFKTYQAIAKNYATQDFLMLAFNPKSGDIFSEDSLQTLQQITQELSTIAEVDSTLNILNAPLLKSSPKLDLQEALEINPTLLSPLVDKNLAKEEFLNHPFYSKNILSKDLKTTGIIVYLKKDAKLEELENLKEDATTPSKNLQALIKEYKQQSQIQNTHTINAIKALKNKYEGLYIGGIPLIANDMIAYVKSDLITYGSTLTIILALMLWMFFRQLHFVFLTLGICFFTLVVSSGIFSFFGYEITVISSNYISLLLIINVSLIVHLIVSYLEFYQKFPNASAKNLLYAVMLAKKSPSFYAILTTMIGFLSLIFSNILPIIHLGIIMSIGVSSALIFTYILFGAILALLPKPKSIKSLPKWHQKLLHSCANIGLKETKIIYPITLLIFLFSLYGITHLKVENSFVNYFKDKSEIKQGLLLIDNQLGGTIPLEILVTFPQKALNNTLFSDFEEEFNILQNEDSYWFDSQKLRIAKIIHTTLEKEEFVGSILSLHTLSQLLQSLGLEPNDFMFAFLYKNTSPALKSQLFAPYANIDKNQIRFVLRIFDSNPHLQRNAFLLKTQETLNNLLNGESLKIEINGAMVLYNNLLQTLISSQINTLSLVILAIFGVFIFVFKSFKLSIIALLINLIPLGVIFGILGVVNIPLDLMAVTIAAIALGIGVDDAIHYIHRFKEEIKRNPLKTAIRNSHQYIGSAMYYTTFIIVVGFCAMMSSNFIPTIYFGFLTTLVMLLMLLSSLILLPALLKSFYKDKIPSNCKQSL
ncbi:efflux RND transporter permease subunit [Helicobacter mesocricetorum]|uniref:efflux RND transporter permease subunit n=1 Tax=Helicobacter mesocricetorum TaxID=87012 RepID=UPI000CF15628|nr:MMPL family transporter [Helicobacter mesocricetorum]